MAYSQVTDVRAALTLDGNAFDEDTPSSYSDEQLTDCINRADAEIDLYLRSSYTVPVTAPDGLLRDWSSSIACYLAALVQANGLDISKTDPVQIRYDRVLSALKLVAEGTVTLPYPGTEVVGEEAPVVVNRLPDDFQILGSPTDGYTYWPCGVQKADGTWYGPGQE
jgi:phage gp36-like protein